MESKITNDMPIRIITCKENEVLSMFKLGNIYIYLPIPAKF